MLNERIFLGGGIACVVSGVLFLGFLIVEGALEAEPVLGYPGVLFLVFGSIFLYTGWEARRDRLALLRSGELGVPGSRP